MLETPGNAVEDRLDDAVTAYLEALEAGGAPSREEWLARYPDLADGLATYFADTDRVRCWTVLFFRAVRDTAPSAPGAARFGDYESSLRRDRAAAVRGSFTRPDKSDSIARSRSRWFASPGTTRKSKRSDCAMKPRR